MLLRDDASQHEREHAGDGHHLAYPEEERPAQELHSQVCKPFLHFYAERGHLHRQTVVETLASNVQHVLAPVDGQIFSEPFQITGGNVSQPLSKCCRHWLHRNATLSRPPADDDAIVEDRCQQGRPLFQVSGHASGDRRHELNGDDRRSLAAVGAFRVVTERHLRDPRD